MKLSVLLSLWTEVQNSSKYLKIYLLLRRKHCHY